MNNNDFRNFAVKHLGKNGTSVDDVIAHQIKAMTPYILEEREMRVTQMDVFSRLMMDKIIWVSGVVDDVMADIIQAQLLFLDSVEEKKDVTLQINTQGGSVLHGLGIRDVMNYVTSDIKTVNLGMCASMGSILLSSGTKGKRSSLIYSRIMTHHVSSGTQGVVDEQRISMLETEKYNYLLFKILAENTGKSFEEIHDLSNRDKWFNSDEALEYGLIDEIIGLDKHNSITEMMVGFDDYYDKYVMKGLKK